MRPIILRISFFATANPRILKNSQYLAFSTQTHKNPFLNYQNRRHEEEGRCVRVSVWWDFENCSLPWNTNVFRVAQGITNAVRANGIKGPINITAFGDVMQISRTNQEALSATGINLCHVPSGGKNSADRSLLVDLMYWVSQNPPPAHIFLISGDRDFAGILHKLRMSNYNILLASPDSAPSVLCSAATIMWQWSSLVKGESLSGKLFNQPPDGPYNSWYGQFQAPLEDPFAVVEQSSCFPAEESAELASDTKVRPIPKAVMKGIREILNLYPEGISISQFRTELARSNLTMDKDLYGFKKFSRFLLAMPNIIRLQPSSKDQFIVKGVNAKCLNESVPTSYVGESEAGSFPQLDGDISTSVDIAENSTVSQIPDLKVKSHFSNLKEFQNGDKRHEQSSSVKAKDYTKTLQDLKKEEKLKESPAKKNMHEIREQDKKIKLQEQTKKVKATSPVIVSKDSVKDENRGVDPEEVCTSESGIFQRIWKKWFASGDMNSKGKNCKKCEETKCGKDNVEEKAVVSSESPEYVHPALFSPSSHEALVDGKIPKGDGAVTDISSQGSGFMNKTTTWFKFWSSPEFNNKVEKTGEAVDQVKVHSKQLELFSKASFWNELESYLDSSPGADVFSQSRTREELAQALQKQGPLVLKSLPERDLLHLIDLLISDKKWVVECSSQAFPFSLTRLAGKDLIDDPPGPNGLSHIFADRQPNLQELGERKHQHPPYTGVQQNVAAHKGSLSKPRREMLADCHKLVDHILKEHPEGFNIGSFRKLFMEKQGYALDLQKLGYEKLVNLLQTIPGVRIESNLILPTGAFWSLKIDLPIQESKIGPESDTRNESLASNKDDDSDSSWDELGPVDNSSPRKQETRKIQKGRTIQKIPDYEPLNEDDFSDSEGETLSRSENETKFKLDEDRSSLLQILDSWYSNGKGDDDKKDESVDITNSMDNADTGASKSTGYTTKTEPPHIKRHKPSKNYSFVAEQPVDSKDKLVDGILGSLKKSNERSSDSRLLG